MTIDGKGPYQIARTFTDEKIIHPSCHIARLNDCVTEKSETNLYNWTVATITNIIRKPEYTGATVNFRTYKTSFKTKKHKLNPPDKWEIFENTHKSIIDEQTYETVQNLLGTPLRPSDCGEDIRTEVVRQLVLSAIRNVCGYVRENQEEFEVKIREESVIQQEESAKASKRKLSQNQKRIAELDRLFKKPTRTTQAEN